MPGRSSSAGYRRSCDHATGLVIERFALLPDQAMLVERALDLVANRLAAEQGDEAPATRGQQFADALVAVAETVLASGDVGHLRSGSFHLVVHADDEVVDSSVPAGTDAPRSHIERGPSITAETVRRICCDTTLSRVIEVDEKTVVVDDASPTIPAWVRRAVRLRDKTCVFPGCASTQVHVHHLTYRSRQGTHELSNLAQLCRYHHTLCHEGGYRARRVDGMLRFYAPNGRELRRGTHPTVGEVGGLQAAHGQRITPDAAATYLEDGYDLHYIVGAVAEPRPEFRPRGDANPPDEEGEEG